MNILMLLDHRFFPPDIRVEKEARTLIKAGHEVFLLCNRKDGMLYDEVWHDIRIIRKDSPPKFLQRVWNLFWFEALHIDPFWKSSLEIAIQQNGIDALHIHDLPMVKTGLSVAHKFNLPLMADLRENFPEAIDAWGRNWMSKLINPTKRWKRLEKFCVKRVNRVLTVVDEAKEHYINDCGASPEKVDVLINAEDLEYFYSIPIQERIIEEYTPYFTITYIGGAGRHRGIQTVVSAMPKIISKIPDARLLLVSNISKESLLAEAKSDTEKTTVENHVICTGWQDFSLVPSFIAASKVCLIPHIASGHTNTTIPNKLFQYMAMEKPMVVSSAKPLERIVRETGSGLVYPSGDADDLAKAIIRIYENKGLATSLGRAGKEAVETKYDWKIEGKKLISIYEGFKNG